jgi:hypothetical protein
MSDTRIVCTPTASSPRAQWFLNGIAQGLAFRAFLIQLKASLPTYGAAADGDAGADAILTDFGLSNIGGSSFQAFASSAADVMTGAATGTQAAGLLDRVPSR